MNTLVLKADKDIFIYVPISDAAGVNIYLVIEILHNQNISKTLTVNYE